MTPFWDKRVAFWVAARIPGCERGWDNFQAFGVEHKCKLIAGVVLHGWEPDAGVIEVSAAAEDPRWWNRKVLNFGFGYVFDQIGCQMIIARQDPKNQRAIRPWLALGSKEYIIPRLRGRDRDGSVITLTDDAWRQSKYRRP